MIYFDAAATTLQKPPQVRKMAAYAMEHYASPGRGGYRAAMLASDAVYDCRKELAELFFGGLIESAVGESETVRLKPCPDAVLAAAKLMGVSKDECVYVGDSEVDIETARRAGMDCISVAWGFRDEDMLRAEGASCIVHSAEELFDALK